jgi:hypothetical protein
MQYLLLIYQNEAEAAKRSPAALVQLTAEFRTFTQSMVQSGQFKAGDALSRLQLRPRFACVKARR